MIKKAAQFFFNDVYNAVNVYNLHQKEKDIPADINCDDSQVCVGNLTHDTIFYGWNSNTLDDTLLPGHSTCINAGPVRLIHSKRSGAVTDQLTHVVQINSSWGTWAINVEKCYKKSNFEYDPKSSELIQLYAE